MHQQSKARVETCAFSIKMRRCYGAAKRIGNMNGTNTRPHKRTATKDKHREALLSATARVVMQHGISGTTISKIQQESGLSRGMINLHFKTKENLILALASQLGDRYNQAWQNSADYNDHPVTSPFEAADRLRNLFKTDMSQGVMNEEAAKLSFVFRAERKLQNAYPHYIDTRHSMLEMAVQECCEILCAATGSQEKATHVATAILCLLEGFWTDYHMHPNKFDRDEALAVCTTVCRAFFPDYFPAYGITQTSAEQPSGA
jgi:TetR/AcrR family transcriptional repressor of bet genes